MSTSTQPTFETAKKNIAVKVFGVGTAGIKVMERMIRSGQVRASYAAVETDPEILGLSSASEKVHLENGPVRGLGSGGDPERGRELAEAAFDRLKALCEGAQAVFILCGLGGGAGTGISPVLARAARESGALALGFAVTPFQCEGSRRQKTARLGLEELKDSADGVICLPNQKMLRLVKVDASALDTFKLSDELLADGVAAVWHLLTHKGLLEIHFADVCDLVRDRHSESAFAVVEAMGPTRCRDVMDKLLAHPMLEGGSVLKESQTLLVSLTGGADLGMVEIDRVMEQVQQHCRQAKIVMGAVIDPEFQDRLAVTLIAALPAREPVQEEPVAGAEPLRSHYLDPTASVRTESRILPPAPPAQPELVERIIERDRGSRSGSRKAKAAAKLRQTQLALDIVSKGRFDKSEPTIHKGEDLDVPTYMRRGVPLN
jgi:cell division protein FtsZ